MPPKSGRKKRATMVSEKPQSRSAARVVVSGRWSNASSVSEPRARRMARTRSLSRNVPIGPNRLASAAPGIGDTVEATAIAHECARGEARQFECLIVEDGARLRVGGEQDLEAAIAKKTLDAVGLNPTAQALLRLQQLKRHARAIQFNCATKARHASAYDNHVMHLTPRKCR